MVKMKMGQDDIGNLRCVKTIIIQITFKINDIGWAKVASEFFTLFVTYPGIN